MGDGWLAEAVADGGGGQEILGVGGIVFDSFTELADVGSEIFDVVLVLGSPDGAQDFFVRDGAALTAHEQVEDVELRSGERDGVASLEEDAAIAAEGDLSVVDGGVGEGGKAAAADGGLDAGDEFADGEGFGDVVIGTGFEGFDFVVDCVADGEHEDGKGGGHAADDAAGGETSHAGHVDVEQDGIEAGWADEGDGFFGMRGAHDFEAEWKQGGGDDFVDGDFVIDDE